MTVIIARPELPTDGPKVAPAVSDDQYNTLIISEIRSSPIGSISQL